MGSWPAGVSQEGEDPGSPGPRPGASSVSLPGGVLPQGHGETFLLTAPVIFDGVCKEAGAAPGISAKGALCLHPLRGRSKKGSSPEWGAPVQVTPWPRGGGGRALLGEGLAPTRCSAAESLGGRYSSGAHPGPVVPPHVRAGTADRRNPQRRIAPSTMLSYKPACFCEQYTPESKGT